MKKLWTALCAVAMVGMTMLPAQAQEKTIKMGTLSWEDLTPITGITKKGEQQEPWEVGSLGG